MAAQLVKRGKYSSSNSESVQKCTSVRMLLGHCSMSKSAQTEIASLSNIGSSLWRPSPMINFETGKWRKIAEQLVTEPDPTKLLALVEQLNEEMDRAESARSTIDLL